MNSFQKKGSFTDEDIYNETWRDKVE